MKFIQHFSGSDGNMYEVIANNGKRLIIDVGRPWKQIIKKLDYNLDGIVAVLLDHCHSDHSKAVKDAMKNGIDVYASWGTFEALGLTDERRVNVVSNKTLVRDLGPFEVLCFDTEHDAPEPLGFVVREPGRWEHATMDRPSDEYLLFVTDTYHIKQKFKIPFNIIAIECSYNGAYLKKRVDDGTINEHLAKRLLESHMEEQTTLSYLKECCNLDKCEEIHLIHMSADNINKERIVKEFEKELIGIEVVTL